MSTQEQEEVYEYRFSVLLSAELSLDADLCKLFNMLDTSDLARECTEAEFNQFWRGLNKHGFDLVLVRRTPVPEWELVYETPAIR